MHASGPCAIYPKRLPSIYHRAGPSRPFHPSPIITRIIVSSCCVCVNCCSTSSRSVRMCENAFVFTSRALDRKAMKAADGMNFGCHYHIISNIDGTENATARRVTMHQQRWRCGGWRRPRPRKPSIWLTQFHICFERNKGRRHSVLRIDCVYMLRCKKATQKIGLYPSPSPPLALCPPCLIGA